MSRLFGWDLPPGVNASDIPGNRPEDEEWERIEEDFYDGLSMPDVAIVDTTAGIGGIITKAIDYGMTVAREKQKLIDEENKFYEGEAKLD